MAAGDIVFVGNSSNGDQIPNAPGTYDALWPDTIQAFGLGAGSASSDGKIELTAGRYLVMYSEYFNTANTTNNERIEIQGEIHTDANGVEGGYAQGFIRKSSGDQDCAVAGSMILEVSSTTNVFVRFYRTDNSTTGSVNRVTGFGQFSVMELDDVGDNFGMYSKSVTQNLTGTTESTVTFPTTDVQDTGFSISSNIVTVTTAGRYLVTYDINLTTTGTGREDIVGFLRNSSSEITGTRSFCYIRGNDGCQDGALTWIGILDLAASSTIDLRAWCPTSATIGMTSARLQFWQLPTAADTVIMEATTGNYNTNGTFTYDTVPHIDTAEFTATGATDTITLDNGGVYLAFASLAQNAVGSPQRAVPRLRFLIDDVAIEGVADAYHRNSGGTGRIAITNRAAFYVEGTNSTLKLRIDQTGASGTLTNTLGQFSVLNLNSIYGAYIPPPLITDVDGDDQITISSVNVVATGARFEAVQGTGKLEAWSDTSGTIKVVQTIDSWSDTSIQFDFVQGSLTNNQTIYFVVTTDGGDESPAKGVFLGIKPLDDYFDIYDALDPDHWWRFNNDAYADSGTFASNPITNSVIGGGGAFVTDPIICEQNTHSWRNQRGSRREPSNSNQMNGQVETTRTMAGWIRVNDVDPALSCLYEEGGGVNNLCLLLGIGNILVASYADTSDDNAQAYSDFPLSPDRDYFYTWSFDHNAGTKEFRLWIDGVKQSVTSGNPLTSGDLDAHSGDISFGGPGGSLEVGGTDVTFLTSQDCFYANWASWTVLLDEADILELFQRGARPVRTISSDTIANMQIDVDTYADTAFPDEAMSMRIFETTDGIGLEEDIDLDFDNITFDSGTSIQIEYRGGGTLTITNLNGSNTDVTKCLAPRGGTVVVVNPATLTLTGLQNPSEVRVYEAGTTTEVAGQENVTTGTFAATIQTSSVDIVIVSLDFQIERLEGIDTTSDITLPIQQRVDRNFNNP